MSNNCCNKIINFLKNKGSLIIWGMGVVLYVFLLLMCVLVMCHKNSNNNSKLSESCIDKLSIDLQVKDSLGKVDPIVIEKIDTLISVVNEWNNYREENISQGLNNLRQETNNVIEKQNAWLAFWIAILTIVGALIPSLLQLRNERRIDSELKKIIEQHDNIEKESMTSKISQLSNTLISIIENIRFINLNDRAQYINMLLDGICNKTKDYFDSLRTTERNIDITHLRNVLLQLLSAYNVCRQLPVGRYRNRQLSMLTNSINLILGNLYNNTRNQGQNIANNLNRLLEQMNSFRIG